MNLALAQLDTTVGDLQGNAARIREAVATAARSGAELVLFPELTLTGYPPQDLLDRPAFLDAALTAERALVAELAHGPTVVFGTIRPGRGRPCTNAAVVAHGGQVLGVGEKALLPTYDVFDEDRWFSPGAPLLLDLGGRRTAVTICEDLWTGPAATERARHAGHLDLPGAQLVLNLSASPFERGKPARRHDVMAQAARRVGAPVAHVNLVGANDELIFDGGSACFDAQGQPLALGPAFREAVVPVHLHAAPVAAPAAHDLRQVVDALVLGIAGYVRKAGARGVVLGLSGGIDSAVTAALAVRALGPERVVGLAMPSEFSSDHSLEDARALADGLGIALHTVPIQGPLQALRTALQPTLGDGPWGLTDENLQARIRGQLLMAWSNRHGHLVLSTGNKSELSVGYSTLYGDLCGAISPIGDLWKTDVYAVARLLRADDPRALPERSITKAPSAELRPDQKDQDSLPPYPALDRVLAALIEERRSLAEAVALGVLPAAEVERVARLVRLAEYKRRQAPIVLRVSGKAFGGGRRMPVAAA